MAIADAAFQGNGEGGLGAGGRTKAQQGSEPQAGCKAAEHRHAEGPLGADSKLTRPAAAVSRPAKI